MNDLVHLAIPGREYDIRIEPGLLARAGQILAAAGRRGRVLLVTNPTIARWHLAPVSQGLRGNGFTVHEALVPDGETYKSLQEASGLYDRAAAAQMDRGDLIIGLGGGVIGDLAGFVAATYLRGLAFVQIPTTMLAQIDSSIGGKVAVNHPAGKNLIGAFYQPALVLTDPETLRTLPEREIRQGLVEMLKHGLLDADYFAWYERHLGAMLALEIGVIQEGIAGSCRIKAAVVEADERELGGRALLNLGHTVGHAFENVAGYGVWRHGEAVGLGLVVAGRLAQQLGWMSGAERGRLEAAVRGTLGALPPLEREQIEPMLKAMFLDKKTLGGRLRFVLPRGIGRAEVTEEVTPGMVRRELLYLAEAEAE